MTRQIPSDEYDEFTLAGRVPVEDDFVDDSREQAEALVCSMEQLRGMRAAASRRETRYYGDTDLFLYEALEQYPVRELDVAVIGSTTPWYEAICLEFNAGRVTTIDYNRIVSESPSIRTLTVSEYDRSPVKFAAALAISSFEHDGLGRYGDPVRPNGDLLAMRKMKRMLAPAGLFYLAVPIGRDRIVWNRHRIYGRLRLPLLLDGWDRLAAFGYREGELDVERSDSGYQPVLVLRNAMEH